LHVQDTAGPIQRPLLRDLEDLFVKCGTGGLNDYWSDASLGSINLDGTEISNGARFNNLAPTS